MSKSVEYGVGMCQRREYRLKPGGGNLWESQRGRESQENLARRHFEARVLCRRCPLLEECEAMVCFFEARGEEVDGVVAGRESVAFGKYNKNRIVRCRGCRAPLRPPLMRSARDFPDVKDHAGEQLCKDCFPRFSRKARRINKERK